MKTTETKPWNWCNWLSQHALHHHHQHQKIWGHRVDNGLNTTCGWKGTCILVGIRSSGTSNVTTPQFDWCFHTCICELYTTAFILKLQNLPTVTSLNILYISFWSGANLEAHGGCLQMTTVHQPPKPPKPLETAMICRRRDSGWVSAGFSPFEWVNWMMWYGKRW